MKSRTAVSWRAVVVATVLASALASHAAFTNTYAFTSGSTAATGVPTGVTMGAFGETALNASSYNGTATAKGWNAVGSTPGSSYFSFTITPTANYAMTLTRIELDAGANMNSWAIYSSVNNYSTALFSTTSSGNDLGATLSAATFGNLTSAVTFRIYGYAGNNGTDWSIDNVQLMGDVSAVPEPTHVALGIFGGLLGLGGVWRHRRQRTSVSI